MKVLVVGANGYIGLRLVIQLLAAKATVYALVRSPERLDLPSKEKGKIHFLVGDLLNPSSLPEIPKDLDAAFYLVHSMSQSHSFESLEEQCAHHFLQAVKGRNLKQLIYLSGIYPKGEASPHLASRQKVESILTSSSIPSTVFRASIILGSGSASFEIIRDLVEKLPVMTTPLWVSNKTQPIAVRDVLRYLVGSIGKKDCLNQVFEIGGEEIITYRDLMLKYAKIRGLKRWIIVVPFLTLELSSLWLYFVSTVPFSLCKALVYSLYKPLVCCDERIKSIIPLELTSLDDAFKQALKKIEDKEVVSSWRDAWSVSQFSQKRLEDFITPPTNGCFIDQQLADLEEENEEKVVEKFFSIGGNNGWYYWNWAWKLRGFLDLCLGGVGLSRGRTSKQGLLPGDSIDFWRVIIANKAKKHLLLYSEMMLPGEAWLEFKVENKQLKQCATFRPLGVWGRLYWYMMLPFHFFIFKGMAHNIAKKAP